MTLKEGQSIGDGVVVKLVNRPKPKHPCALPVESLGWYKGDCWRCVCGQTWEWDQIGTEVMGWKKVNELVNRTV